MAPERASGRVGECVRVQAARRRAGARSRVGRTEGEGRGAGGDGDSVSRAAAFWQTGKNGIFSVF